MTADKQYEYIKDSMHDLTKRLNTINDDRATVATIATILSGCCESSQWVKIIAGVVNALSEGENEDEE